MNLSVWLCFRDIIYTTLIADTDSTASALVRTVCGEQKITKPDRRTDMETKQEAASASSSPCRSRLGSLVPLLIVRVPERTLNSSKELPEGS